MVNTTALIHDRVRIDDCFKFTKNGIHGLHKRFFTVQSVTNSECLILPFTDLDNMKREFKLTSNDFFRIMMVQTQKMLYFQKKAIENQENCQIVKLKRSRTDKRI